MIVGFTKKSRQFACRAASNNSHSRTTVHCWAGSTSGKAIDSTPLARYPLSGRYRIIETKTLKKEADEAEWNKPVSGLKRGSYPMKWSLVMFIAMLFAVPTAGVAQQAEASGPAAAQSSAPSVADASQAIAKADKSDTAHYVIGAEDTLQITVWKEPTLSGTVPVRPDGRISLVLLGDLPAAGMTPMQLAADIAQRLKKYIQDPSVSVVVLAVNSQRIFIIGEVGHVGAVSMTAGMTPLQAIAAAGGLSPFAHAKSIYILRGTGAAQKKIPFNYKKALKGDDKQDVSLEPGDTIVVP
ncbi:polysaccharide biosynthesis/export family protein [Edaphobacter paludis]|uniref:Polysaccharide biosynthesis/export family protein n=1 Tax=Edaphobacter paludis TaxID=3035702 RepID=A0AAU7CZE5_9BACT